MNNKVEYVLMTIILVILNIKDNLVHNAKTTQFVSLLLKYKINKPQENIFSYTAKEIYF